MHITLVDDSLPFDASTSASQPLGGAEKSFAALPGALVRRGHTVRVFNRCHWGLESEGARWETLDSATRFSPTDVLIAFRKPALLEFVRQAQRRVLWTTAPVRTLEKKSTQALLEAHRPALVFTSESQRQAWRGNPTLPVMVLPPAVNEAYRKERASDRVQTPRAIVTTNPTHGLAEVLNVWIGQVLPQVPEAELHIYSIGLHQALRGEAASPDLLALAGRIAQLPTVSVLYPRGDDAMAEAYRQAWVHLYPSHDDDQTAFTLLESQATGLAAVVGARGAGLSRIENGRTGYAVPDWEAFGNVTAMMLGNEAIVREIGLEAKARAKGWSWDAAAAALESLLS